MRSVILIMALLLAGCATSTARAPSVASERTSGDFSVDARFSLSSGSERYAGRLFWRRNGTLEELQVSSPFGQMLAVLTIQPGGARLETAERRVFAAADAEALMREALGYELPVTRLASWLRGKPDASARVTRDAGARVTLAEDAGWRIEYDYSDAAASLPERLLVTRADGFELRLRIEEWQFE